MIWQLNHKLEPRNFLTIFSSNDKSLTFKLCMKMIWIMSLKFDICVQSQTTDAQWSLFSLKSRCSGQTNSGAFGVFSAELQLRDPKNDFILNFNFDDKMKKLWTVWISCKINQHYSTHERMSWAKTHSNLCKLLETELRLAQRLTQLL